MARKLKIEKHVPMPCGPPRGRALAYPFMKMKVCDSFLIRCDAETAKKKQMNVANAASHLRHWRPETHLNFRIKTATVPEGLRVWRIM